MRRRSPAPRVRCALEEQPPSAADEARGTTVTIRLEQIGRYRIDRELGRGSTGVVYKAFDPLVERAVAVKTISLDSQNPLEYAGRLRREAKSIGRLEHPNIVTLYDAGEFGQLFFLVMQFVEGETLRQVLDRGRALPLGEIRGLIRQVCTGLHYAHERGVVHRDIKPGNILISSEGPEGIVKLTDFGIASLVNEGPTTRTVVKGTAPYMSPEQATGRPLDRRSDIFALGTVLYELIAGERPFRGETPGGVAYNIVHEAPVSPAHFRRDLHPELERVVLKALAKNPDERFQTALELFGALEGAADPLCAGTGAGRARGFFRGTQKRLHHRGRRDHRDPRNHGEGPGGLHGLGDGILFGSRLRPRYGMVALLCLALIVTVSGAFRLERRRQPSSTEPAPRPVVAQTAPQPPAQPTTKAMSDGQRTELPDRNRDRWPNLVSRQPLAPQAPARARRPASKTQPSRPTQSTERAPAPPDTFDTLMVKGDLACVAGDYSTARENYAKAYQLNPYNSVVRRKLRDVLRLLGRAKEAEIYK